MHTTSTLLCITLPNLLKIVLIIWRLSDIANSNLLHLNEIRITVLQQNQWQQMVHSHFFCAKKALGYIQVKSSTP